MIGLTPVDRPWRRALRGVMIGGIGVIGQSALSDRIAELIVMSGVSRRSVMRRARVKIVGVNRVATGT